MYIKQYFHGLLDYSTKVVLTIGTSNSTMSFLTECIPETIVIPSINHPNYSESVIRRFVFEFIKPEQYPKWTWNGQKRILEKTEKNLLTEEVFAKSRLAESKRAAIAKIVTHLSATRAKSVMSLQFQDTIYLTKKLQAEKFKERGYIEDSILEYPYVLQYANYANVSLRQAADDILFKAKLSDQFLANTELLRLKYFNKVREAPTPEEMPLIYGEFLKDHFYI